MSSESIHLDLHAARYRRICIREREVPAEAVEELLRDLRDAIADSVAETDSMDLAGDWNRLIDTLNALIATHSPVEEGLS